MFLEEETILEVTTLAKEVNPDVYKDYAHVFLGMIDRIVWVYRVFENMDSNYNKCEGHFLIERDRLKTLTYAIKALPKSSIKFRLQNDPRECWDEHEVEGEGGLKEYLRSKGRLTIPDEELCHWGPKKNSNVVSW